MGPTASVIVRLAVSLKARTQEAAAPAPAPQARPRPQTATSSAELVRDGPNLPGNPSSAIPTTVCATRRTFPSSPPTVSGVTTTFFVGQIRQSKALPPAQAVPAAGPARAGLLSARPSWPVFRRSLTKRWARARAIPILLTTNSPPPNTAPAPPVPATHRTETRSPAAASFTTSPSATWT